MNQHKCEMSEADKIDILRKEIILYHLDARSCWELIKYLCTWGILRAECSKRKKELSGGFTTGEQEKQFIFGERLATVERLMRVTEGRDVLSAYGEVPDSFQRDIGSQHKKEGE